MAYSLEALSETNSHEWDGFNLHSPEGTFCHSIQWKNLLEEEFGLVGRYYLIRDDREIVGICPWIGESKGFLQGLNCIPHSEFNNILLDDSFDPARIDEVLAFFARKFSFVHFNTYDTRIIDAIRYPAYPYSDSGNMILDLNQNPPDALWSSFSNKMRKDIRMFGNNGFEPREVHETRDIEAFYRYHRENMTRLNGGIMPLSFFQNILDHFLQGQVRIVVLEKEDLFAGGMMSILHPGKKGLNFEYLALNRNIPNRYTPTYPLFWEGIVWAWEHGIERISFGQQKFEPDNPRFRNKLKFGAEFVPIHSRIVFFSRTTAHLYRLRQMLYARTIPYYGSILRTAMFL